MTQRLTFPFLAVVACLVHLGGIAPAMAQDGPFKGKVLKLKETGDYEVWRVAADAVKNPATPAEGKGGATGKGEKIVVVLVTVEVTRSSGAYSGAHFRLEDSTGKWYAPTALGLGNALGGGFLDAGQRASGEVGFVVPEGAAGLKLIYKPFESKPPAFAVSL